MADSALQAIAHAEAVGAWDAELRRFFTALHRLLVAHPAMARVMSERPLEGRTATRQGDQILQLLIAAWLDEHPAVAALVAIVSYPPGASLHSLARETAREARKRGSTSCPPTPHRSPTGFGPHSPRRLASGSSLTD
jgi:hypothetical protein